MATSCHAPAAKRSFSRAPSGNPLPRRGQVKERILKNIVVAVGTAAVLACDRTAKKDGGSKPPTVEVAAKN